MRNRDLTREIRSRWREDYARHQQRHQLRPAPSVLDPRRAGENRTIPITADEPFHDAGFLALRWLELSALLGRRGFG